MINRVHPIEIVGLQLHTKCGREPKAKIIDIVANPLSTALIEALSQGLCFQESSVLAATLQGLNLHGPIEY